MAKFQTGKAALTEAVLLFPQMHKFYLIASCTPLAKAAASVSEVPPLRGLEERINTFLFIVKHSLRFVFWCATLMIRHKPDFR